MFSKQCLALLLVSFLFSSSSFAKVSATEAQRLGKNLTPIGAQKSGNASGSIPAWTGGIKTPPEDYVQGQFHADPFANEKIQITINSKNWKKHKKWLTLGQIALLKKYPSYAIHVYPSHRSAAYPDYVYDAIKQNATTAELQKYGTGVTNTIMSSPFPIPQNGAEALWNHILRYRGLRWEGTSSTLATSPSGAQMLSTQENKYYFAYSEPGITLDEIDNKIFYLKRKIIAPAKLSGQMTLVHETLDQVLSPRKAWVYLPGQRRVKRSPNLTYDTLDGNSNDMRTLDQVDMFNGAPVLYDWNLLGKTEKYIPYNAYRLHKGGLAVEDLTTENHIEAKFARYEPHRVWVIEAKLRTGMKHLYYKRLYYLDEDSWQIILSEDYDKEGKLVQYSESHTINYYEIPMIFSTLAVNYDLDKGGYFVEGLDNERSPLNADVNFKRREFTASALRREAR